MLTGIPIKPETCKCSNYRKTVHKCAHCGIILVNPILVVDEEVHYLCDKCTKGLGTCENCRNSNLCLFEADPNPQKMVQKRVQQGNMISVVEIPNPEIIERTCKTKCKCFNSELGCMRQFEYCKNKDDYI